VALEALEALKSPKLEVTHMKLLLPIAVSVLLPVFSLPAYAQRGHPQEARPAQQQARPAPQQQRQARPAPRQQTQQARPAQQPQQQAARPQRQQQVHAVARAPQGNPGRSQARAQQAQPAARIEGGHEHGRISNEHYESHFGNRHSFHVSRGDYDNRRFYYGGYGFAFIDPWPLGWGYSDDVYVEYGDGGYYMYNRFHPGVRISINIL
jgi:hypothetical protein